MTSLTTMDKLLFWLGIGAAQKGAGSKPLDRRNRALSFAVGTLLALLIAVGMFILVGQSTMSPCSSVSVLRTTSF